MERAGKVDWGSLVAFGALTLSLFVFFETRSQEGTLAFVDLVLEQSDSCSEFEDRVLSLQDRGLTVDQIIDAINAEPTVDVRDGFPQADADLGPAYDVFYEPTCGDVRPMLEATEAARRQSRPGD